MIKKFEDYIKENKEYLSYDEIDLDYFTNRYLVGKFFTSEKEAEQYLIDKLNQKDNFDKKIIDDFIFIKKKEDNSLRPWRIYPKPTQEQINRNLASDFIKKYGILSTPDLRYISQPLYAYVENKYKQRLKELGVYYQFKPLKNINFIPVLQRVIKEKIGNSIIKNDEKGRFIIQFYGGLSNKTMSELQEFGENLVQVVKDFNNMIGTDFYISKIKPIKDIRKSLLQKLDPEKYKEDENIIYDDCLFILERGDDEDEFLAVVPMETLEKPKMISKK